jgi:hypothetical protein
MVEYDGFGNFPIHQKVLVSLMDFNYRYNRFDRIIVSNRIISGIRVTVPVERIIRVGDHPIRLVELYYTRVAIASAVVILALLAAKRVLSYTTHS